MTSRGNRILCKEIPPTLPPQKLHPASAMKAPRRSRLCSEEGSESEFLLLRGEIDCESEFLLLCGEIGRESEFLLLCEEIDIVSSCCCVKR